MLTTYIPLNIFRCDDSVVVVDRELDGVEEPLVTGVAEELLVVLVQRSWVERHPAREALDTTPVVWLSVGGHHLLMKE